MCGSFSWRMNPGYCWSVSASPMLRTRSKYAAAKNAACLVALSTNARPLRHARAYASETTSNLTKPAFPLKRIVADPAAYERSVDLRKVVLHKGQTIADLVRLYEEVADLKRARQDAATERNRAVEAVKQAVASMQKRDVLPNELRERSTRAKQRIAALEKQLTETEAELNELVDTVPNLVEPSTAQIDGEFAVLRQTAAPLIQSSPERDHVSIGVRRGILDISSASRVSGTGNAYLVGAGALLEQALVQYALARCTSLGFKLVSAPSLVRSEFINACGFKPRDESTHIYEVKHTPLGLAGTAEIPLAAQLAEQRISDLPRMHCGTMRSFRAEAASKGADTRGLYRLHEFTKVEMFVWAHAKSSAEMLQWLVATQESIFHDLFDGFVPLRTIQLAATDLGAPAYQKFDIEAWMPGRGTWGELSSASNCLDFQSRRLHTVDENGNFVHTLNATALAVPRVIVAIIENGWDPETDKIRLPRALHQYMGADCI